MLNSYGGRYPHLRQFSHYLYSAVMYIVITRGLRIAHVRRLSYQLFFMQSPFALSLPAFELLRSHTTHLTQLRILFPTASGMIFEAPTSALSVRTPVIPRGYQVRPGRRQCSGVIPPASGCAPEASQGTGRRPYAAAPGRTPITVSLPLLALLASDAPKVN